MPDAMIGRRLGHCTLVELVGEGGMGSVYRARHTVLDKDVAVKILAPAVRRDKDLVQRLFREARLAARIDHPGVVTVLDAGDEDGIPYLVMPYVKGKNLDDILKERKRLKPVEALSAVKKAARAFAAAHRLGIIHRDVKPANLIATTDGRIKVTDFGLALTANDPRLTQADCVVGTPQFMSPEQVTSETLDARTDIYSLGATLYALLAGEAPYAGGMPLTIVMQHADPDDRPRPIRDLVPDLPEALYGIVERMMAKKPEDRYPDMETVIRDLDAAQRLLRATDPAGGIRLTPRTRWLAMAAGAAIVLAVLILFLAGGPSEARQALEAADRAAAAAETPDELLAAAKRYREIASTFPGTPSARDAEARGNQLEGRARDAGAKPKPTPVTPEAAARTALETRCRAYLDLVCTKMPKVSPPQKPDLSRKLVEYVDPQLRDTPAERLAMQIRAGSGIHALRREGWKLERHTIDDIRIDAASRQAEVRVTHEASHPQLGRRRQQDTYAWVERDGTWYVVPTLRDRADGEDVRRPPRRSGR